MPIHAEHRGRGKLLRYHGVEIGMTCDATGIAAFRGFALLNDWLDARVSGEES